MALTSGCASATPASKQLYENPEFGIQLMKPGSWDVTYSERSGLIVLRADQGVSHRDSVRIEILGIACGTYAGDIRSPIEVLDRDIRRIGDLYDLDSVTIIQAPVNVATGSHDVTVATIQIPVAAMSDDPNRIQVGNQRPGELQTVDMFVIKEGDYSVTAYIYEGNSVTLNDEARAIIDSVHVTCLPSH